MGAVQVTVQNDTRDLILNGKALSADQETIVQDAGRTAVLEYGTVMAKIAATGKWTPLVSLTTTTGASVARGVYVGPDIAAADLVAGDVVDAPIIVGGGGLVLDENMIVMDEGTLSLDDVFSASDATNVYYKLMVRDVLASFGIYVGDSIDITEQQS